LTYNNIKNKFKINNIIFLIPLTPAPLPQGERGMAELQREEGDRNCKGERRMAELQRRKGNGNHKGERETETTNERGTETTN